VAEWSKVLGFHLGDLRLEPRFDPFSSFRLTLSSRFHLQRLGPSSVATSKEPVNHACLRIKFYVTNLWVLLGLSTISHAARFHTGFGCSVPQTLLARTQSSRAAQINVWVGAEA
jgi:hypothetical protein